MNPKEKAASKSAVKKKKQRSPKVRFILTVLKIIAVITIAFTCAIIGIVGGAVFGYIKTAPVITPEQLELKNQTSIIYDMKNKEIAQLKGAENRLLVEHDQIPDNLRNAFVAIEDSRFYNHSGVDIKRFIGAAISYVTNFGEAEYGGSTITQQLVKNITGNTQNSIPRKIQEAWQAIQLEKAVPNKDVILDNYMNRILIGPNLYGVQTAAKTYFGKDVSKLSLAECASIAGITKYPDYYAPISPKRKEHNKDRQKVILKEMLNQNYITQEEYDQAIQEELAFVDQSKSTSQNSKAQSYFVDQVVNDVIKDLMEKNKWSRDTASIEVYNHGLKIYTTQDSDIQKAMDDVFTNEKYFASPAKKGEHAQASMTLIDPQNGQVRAIRGGYGQKNASFTLNRATQSKRSAGSSFKPIADYAPAIDLGLITNATVLDDVPVYMDNQKPNEIYPKNYITSAGKREYMGLSTTRTAIAKSINVFAAKVWMNLGPDHSIEYLGKVGINLKKEEDGTLSMSLGGLHKGVNTFQMAASYVPFANKGVYFQPITYLKVKDKDDNTLLEKKTMQKKNIAYKETTAFLMTSMLQDVCRSGGTANVAYEGEIQGQLQKGKMPTAGKTGTTNDDKDRWFVGYTHYYVGAVWYGYDNNYEVKVTDGINPALKIWHAVMEKAHKGLSPKPLTEQPADIVKKTVCIDSGKVAGEHCAKDPRGSRLREEFFEKGTEPSDEDKCDVHVLAKVCTASKDIYGRPLVAGNYCPVSTTLQKVFIIRKEPYMPKNPKDPYPNDWIFELPAGEYCTVHGASRANTSANTETKSNYNGNKLLLPEITLPEDTKKAN